MKIESAYYPGVMTSEIITHIRPDIDEAGCLWAGSRLGEDLWPGFDFALSQGKVRFVEAGMRPVHEQHPDELERNGVVVFGTWGGRYDEHPYDGQPAKAKSAIDLVAARLLLATRYPKLKKLVEEISRADSQPTNGYLTAGRAIKAMHGLGGKSPLDVLNWAFFALDALRFADEYSEKIDGKVLVTLQQFFNRWALAQGLERENPFRGKMWHEISQAEKKLEYLSLHRIARAAQCMPGGGERAVERWIFDTFNAYWAEYEAFQKALSTPHKVHQVKLEDGKVKKVVVIEGDFGMADKAMRFKYKRDLAFFVQRRKSGLTQILGSINPKTNEPDFNIGELAKQIRKAEASARGIDTTGMDLSIEGVVRGLECWYRFKQALFNGTPKNNKVDPTKLSLDQITEIVLKFLSGQRENP